MRFKSRVSLVGTRGWMIRTYPVFSSGPELKYVLLWNGTLIRVAIGFSASSSAFSLVSDAWAKHGAAATMMVAVTQRQLDPRECIAVQPCRSANHFSADRRGIHMHSPPRSTVNVSSTLSGVRVRSGPNPER